MASASQLNFLSGIKSHHYCKQLTVKEMYGKSTKIELYCKVLQLKTHGQISPKYLVVTKPVGLFNRVNNAIQADKTSLKKVNVQLLK